jgi:lipopolysaccharide biosynthesis protein
LPQFHPFKENDEWWGKGFTEWRNVAKAKPRFLGHYQPHIPGDLGFYDLRVPEVRIEQARMAREYGIYGFCYYHYWFNGHLLMERPLEDMLKSGEPDFPFMICWANENWTRVWDGGEKEVLIKQNYSYEDDVNHIKYLIKFFKDPRYIRVDGKPVLLIYRTTKFPDIDKTIGIWRHEAKKENLELYICRFESFGEKGREFLTREIDAAAQFQPHDKKAYIRYRHIFRRGLNYLCRKINLPELFVSKYDYTKYVQFMLNCPLPSLYKCYPCVMPMWDNSPRRKRGFSAFYNCSPLMFGKWLRYVIQQFSPYSEDENFIFINAWNEWAEGNHLEPDLKYGNSYLEEVKRSLCVKK